MNIKKFHSIKNMVISVKEKGFFHLLSSNFLIQFLGFGVILFLPSVLSPDEVGNVRLLQSYSALFILLGTFGYNVALLKVCSEKSADTTKNQVFSYCTLKVILFSIIAYLFLLVFNYFYLKEINPALGYWMPIYGIVIPFAALTYCFSAYLQSQKKIIEFSKVQIYIRLTFLALIIIMTYYFGFIGFIISTILSYIIGILPFFLYISPRNFTSSRNAINASRINSFALFTFLTVTISRLGQFSDLYLLDYLKIPDVQLGVYSFATLFLQGGWLAINTVQTIVSPYISEKQDDKEWVWNRTIYYQKISFLVSIIVAIGMYGFTLILTEYYLDPEYAELPNYMIGIVVRFLLWSTFAIVGASLVGLGRFKENFILLLIITPLSIILGYLFYHPWGIYGVMTAQIIVTFLNCIGLYFIFYKIVKQRT